MFIWLYSYIVLLGIHSRWSLRYGRLVGWWAEFTLASAIDTLYINSIRKPLTLIVKRNWPLFMNFPGWNQRVLEPFFPSLCVQWRRAIVLCRNPIRLVSWAALPSDSPCLESSQASSSSSLSQSFSTSSAATIDTKDTATLTRRTSAAVDRATPE